MECFLYLVNILWVPLNDEKIELSIYINIFFNFLNINSILYLILIKLKVKQLKKIISII